MRMQLPLGGFIFLFLGATTIWAQQQPTVKATTLLKTTTTITGQKLEYPGTIRKSPLRWWRSRRASMLAGTNIRISAMSM